MTTQLFFIKYLDEMCDSDINNYIYKFKVNDMQSNQLRKSSLMKLVTRLLKHYNLGNGHKLCPNVWRIKNYKNIKYLMTKRYVEGSLSYETWKDLIHDCLIKIPLLVDDFFYFCIDHGDPNEIHNWLEILNIDIKSLNSDIRSSMNEPHSQRYNKQDDNYLKMEANCYKLKLSRNDIKVIEKSADFIKFLEEINSIKDEIVFVGIDAEWKPTCILDFDDTVEDNKDGDERIALLQISTREKCFIIDMIKLELSPSHYDLFTNLFLKNENIIKIGYGITEDIKMITKSFINETQPSLSNDHSIDQFRRTIVDLELIANEFALNNLEAFNSASSSQQNVNRDSCKGLSELVYLCFGQGLNKSEQISHWEKRPLRESQIKYAGNLITSFCFVSLKSNFIFFIIKKLWTPFV
jgi:hypothetical protein